MAEAALKPAPVPMTSHARSYSVSPLLQLHPQVVELHVSDPHDEVTLLAFSGTPCMYPAAVRCKLQLAP